MTPDSILPNSLFDDDNNLELEFGKNHPSIRSKSCVQSHWNNIDWKGLLVVIKYCVIFFHIICTTELKLHLFIKINLSLLSMKYLLGKRKSQLSSTNCLSNFTFTLATTEFVNTTNPNYCHWILCHESCLIYGLELHPIIHHMCTVKNSFHFMFLK